MQAGLCQPVGRPAASHVPSHVPPRDGQGVPLVRRFLDKGYFRFHPTEGTFYRKNHVC
jgi:hypothetical protein